MCRRFDDVDYMTANDPALPPLNESQRASLYGELASGAETGELGPASLPPPTP
jgi:hypothetical protein